MGFAGLVPTLAEKRQEAYEQRQLDTIRNLREQLVARSAEVEALRKDAERYRYLRRDLSDPNAERVHCSLEVHQQVNEGEDKPWRCWTTYGSALDAQVDLAMADAALQEKSRDAG